MAEAGESPSSEGAAILGAAIGDAAAREAAPLADVEQDLNNVEAALAALDSGDLDVAEALAAELDAPNAPAPDDEQGNGEEQEPAGPAS